MWLSISLDSCLCCEDVIKSKLVLAHVIFWLISQHPSATPSLMVLGSFDNLLRPHLDRFFRLITSEPLKSSDLFSFFYKYDNYNSPLEKQLLIND